MAKLTIVTQNLDGKIDYKLGESRQKTDSNIIEAIEGKYGKAGMSKEDLNNINIYAVQELSKFRNKITRTIVRPPFNKDIKDADCAEEIWYKAFPWNEFRGGYWDECDIELARETIKIINFHSSPLYDLAIRYTLLKRLYDIQDRLTILLGDFNAAFRNQIKIENVKDGGVIKGSVEEGVIEGEDFLKEITRKYGFIECEDLGELKGEPHYTHTHKNEKDNELKHNKLDHIFISKSLYRLLQKEYKITYIDEVNRDKHPKSAAAFTDHSGIMLTIELPDA